MSKVYESTIDVAVGELRIRVWRSHESAFDALNDSFDDVLNVVEADTPPVVAVRRDVVFRGWSKMGKATLLVKLQQLPHVAAVQFIDTSGPANRGVVIYSEWP